VRPYPKIETLFKRDESFVDPTRLRRPVYATIGRWVVTEKVNGTNVRIIFQVSDGSDERGAGVTFDVRGRSDNASLPPALLSHCTALGDRVLDRVAEIMFEHDLATFTLHGEGYGPKIQGGGRYRSDQGFIMFDVEVGDRRFLSDVEVTETAVRLGVPRVPVLGELSLPEIVQLVEGGFASRVPEVLDDDFKAEGVVARTVEPLYDNRGERLILKLKTKDFRSSVITGVTARRARDLLDWRR
jgi:ATP-dependent RNA circularization protein (DNA/RNA ligase family)